MNHRLICCLSMASACMSLSLLSGCIGSSQPTGPADVRIGTFTVNPSTGPLGMITVSQTGCGSFDVVAPQDWVIDPSHFDGESETEAFRVVKAQENAANFYAFTVSQGLSQSKQIVPVTSAPYGTLKIDGVADAFWADGIPITFGSKEQTSTLRLFWNEDTFFLALETSFQPTALQLSFMDMKQKVSHELLVRDTQVERLVDATRTPIPSSDLTVAHKTTAGKTITELAIDMSVLDKIRFDAGREFHFSLLVYTPTGDIIDLGAVLNRPIAAYGQNDWTNWQNNPTLKDCSDRKPIFGCCSSIH